MATSRWADALGAIVDTMRAVTGYGDPATLAAGEVPVFYGPEYLKHELSSVSSYLCLGWSGDEPPEDAGSWDQTVAGMAATTRPRDENGEIRFRVVVQRGDLEFRTATEDALTVLADLETSVRDDPYSGLGASSNFRWLQVASGTPRMYVGSYEGDNGETVYLGAVTEIDGTLNYYARL